MVFFIIAQSILISLRLQQGSGFTPKEPKSDREVYMESFVKLELSGAKVSSAIIITTALNEKSLIKKRLGTMSRWSEFCELKFKDIQQTPNRKLAIRCNFSNMNQFDTGKALPISENC